MVCGSVTALDIVTNFFWLICLIVDLCSRFVISSIMSIQGNGAFGYLNPGMDH